MLLLFLAAVDLVLNYFEFPIFVIISPLGANTYIAVVIMMIGMMFESYSNEFCCSPVSDPNSNLFHKLFH